MSTESQTVRQVTEALKRPFRGHDLEWRISRSGLNRKNEPFAIVVPYVTARAIMDRLDSTVGGENWQTAMQPTGPMGPKGIAGMSCGIGILLNGHWVWKWDVAQATDIEPVKGAGSGALKRAGVSWGMGRDLYGVGDLFAKVWTKREEAPKGANYAKVKGKGDGAFVEIWWLPPDLPEQQIPAAERTNVDELTSAAAYAITRHGGPTKTQAELLAKLMRSSVFTPDERGKAATWLREKSTQENIGEQIEWAKRRLDAKGK